MSWFYKPYVPVATRRRDAEKKMAALKKKGQSIEPVTAATPRGKIATSFWGQAWCDHLESYSDFSNRLPRGRTYLRNGSVLHLGVDTGKLRALVMGSELYEQTIEIDPLSKAKWEAVKKKCQGGIGSLVELLQGKLSDEIMAIVTDRTHGLFPSPKEIHLKCSCPDWATLCKHLAAVLYGVGARLDQSPELLFKLRGVDHNELIQTDTATLVARRGKGSRRRLASESIGDVFGIDLDQEPSDPPTHPLPTPRKRAVKKGTRDRQPSKSAEKPAKKRKSPVQPVKSKRSIKRTTPS